MPKKPENPHPNAEVGGLIRKSRVTYPPGVETTAERQQFDDDLIAARKGELVADAARDGEVITRWYIDLDVPGRAAFESKRLDLARCKADAEAGHLRRLYTRDLSRIFRSVVKQELFFADMDAWSCIVFAQDIPQVGDAATRTWMRQNIGAFNEYMATRNGVVLQANLREKVENRRWVGRHQSVWGLTYNPRTKGFDFDPLTLDFAVLVFETFVAHGGVGGATARALDALWAAHDPRATLRPQGGAWTAEAVLRVVRCPLYRQETTWGNVNGNRGAAELRLSVPLLIPPTIPADLLAEADRLLALRGPRIEASWQRQKAGRLDYTYGALLRCAWCGGRMRALHYPQHRGQQVGAPGKPRWIGWSCAGVDHSSACPQASSVQQWRLEALVGQTLAQGLALMDEAWGRGVWDNLPARARPKKSAKPSKDSLESMRANLMQQRRRCAEMYQKGIVRNLSVIQDMMAKIDREEERLNAQMGALEAAQASENPPLPAFTPAQWQKLKSAYAAVFVDNRLEQSRALDLEKHTLLRALGAGVHVRVLPREESEFRGRRKPGNTRQYGGRLQIDLELAALNLVGPQALRATESDAQWKEYRRWRIRGGINPSPADET